MSFIQKFLGDFLTMRNQASRFLNTIRLPCHRQKSWMKRDRLETMNARIGRWLKYRARRLRRPTTRDSGNDPLGILMSRLAGVTAPPKARQAFQQYMHESYALEIAPVVDARWAADSVEADGTTLRTKKAPDASFRARVARELFSQLPAEDQQALRERAKTEAQAAKAEYARKMKEPPSRAPEDRQRCIDNLGNFMTAVLRGVAEFTGLYSCVVFGGPMPAFDGDLRTLTVSYGRNQGASPCHFPEWSKARFSRDVLGFMKEWLTTAFTSADCSEAAIPKDNIDNARQALAGAHYTIEQDEGLAKLGGHNDSDDETSDEDSESVGSELDSDVDSEVESQVRGSKKSTGRESGKGKGKAPAKRQVKGKGKETGQSKVKVNANGESAAGRKRKGEEKEKDAGAKRARTGDDNRRLKIKPKPQTKAKSAAQDSAASPLRRSTRAKGATESNSGGDAAAKTRSAPAAKNASNTAGGGSGAAGNASTAPDLSNTARGGSGTARNASAAPCSSNRLSAVGGAPAASRSSSTVGGGLGAAGNVIAVTGSSNSAGGEAGGIIQRSGTEGMDTDVNMVTPDNGQSAATDTAEILLLGTAQLGGLGAEKPGLQGFPPPSGTTRSFFIPLKETTIAPTTSQPHADNPAVSREAPQAASLPPAEIYAGSPAGASGTSSTTPGGDAANVGGEFGRAAGGDVVPPCPQEAAEWFQRLYGGFAARNLGSTFNGLLSVLVQLERMYGWDQGGGKTLGTKNRPAQISEWVKAGRGVRPGQKGGKDPAIPSVSVFDAQWWRWWGGLQPKWRVPDPGRPGKFLRYTYPAPSVENWAALRCPGQNGCLTLVVTLSWWGAKVAGSKDREEVESWEDAVMDVQWVLKGLVAAQTPG